LDAAGRMADATELGPAWAAAELDAAELGAARCRSLER
jgi:hypothetical protein